MDIDILRRALRESWAKDTCFPKMRQGWSKKNPAHGQCYPTSLIVNDYLKGKILRSKFQDGTGHFWNLIGKKKIDLTKSQFKKGEKIPKPIVLTRQQVNRRYNQHNKRYLLLKKRVDKFLKKS